MTKIFWAIDWRGRKHKCATQASAERQAGAGGKVVANRIKNPDNSEDLKFWQGEFAGHLNDVNEDAGSEENLYGDDFGDFTIRNNGKTVTIEYIPADAFDDGAPAMLIFTALAGRTEVWQKRCKTIAAGQKATHAAHKFLA